MATNEQREHERINIQMHTRMWTESDHGTILFEGFANTWDLAIGGTFLESTYLLPLGLPINLEMVIDGGEMLTARGEVAHRLDGDGGRPGGMGVLFTEVDAENRERLLRFFISDRIKDFYFNRFVVEFPHLEPVLSLQDVALTINLWEDKEGRLTALRSTGSTRKQQAQRAETRSKPAARPRGGRRG